MRLFTFEFEAAPRVAAEVKGQLVDLQFGSQYLLRRAGPIEGSAQPLPGDMLSLIRAGGRAFRLAQQAAALGAKRMALPVGERLLYTFDEARILPPITRPPKIICRRGDRSTVLKAPSTMIAPGGQVLRPLSADILDCSVMLAGVLGRSARHMKPSHATEALFGCALLLDASAPNVSDRALAANCDTFCSIGPSLLTQDEFPRLQGDTLTIEANGAAHIEIPLRDALSALTAAIADLSQFLTLEPGDVVAAEPPGHCAARVGAGGSISGESPLLGKLECQVQ